MPGTGGLNSASTPSYPPPHRSSIVSAGAGSNRSSASHRQRHIKDRSTEETRYYISSLQPVNDIAHAIRSHWGVENKVHWVLDVTYRADDSRIRRDDGAPNLGLLRRMCLNLSRLHPKKDSMAGKLKGAGWDDAFRAELIFGHFA